MWVYLASVIQEKTLRLVGVLTHGVRNGRDTETTSGLLPTHSKPTSHKVFYGITGSQIDWHQTINTNF